VPRFRFGQGIVFTPYIQYAGLHRRLVRQAGIALHSSETCLIRPGR
jgi:hypothetical protein